MANGVWNSGAAFVRRDVHPSELRHCGPWVTGAEKQPDELPDLVAELLYHQVEQRLRQNRSRGYVDRYVRGALTHL